MTRRIAVALLLLAPALAGCVYEYHHDRTVVSQSADGTTVTRTEVIRDVYYDPYPVYHAYPSAWWGWYGYPYSYRPHYPCRPRASVGVHYGFHP